MLKGFLMLEQVTEQLLERFFRYTKITSQSNAKIAQIPSTPGQLELAKLLMSELQALGLQNIHLDEYGNVTAFLAGNIKQGHTIGFVAHLDTVDVGISPDIHPQKLRFEGKDLCLNPKKDIWLRVDEHPEIKAYVGNDIIFGDGTSVLGADNKAAIAIIMTTLSQIRTQSHGDIYVAFVPDEEIGLRGSKVLDLERFPVDFAYTIDSCELGEIVYETFNAALAKVQITGVTAHPMSAKNVLVNPLRVAHDLMGYFDRRDTPEHTDGREGYFWFTEIQANPLQANMSIAIRDFDKKAFEARKAFIDQAVRLVQARHPRATINYNVTDIYSNISDSVGSDQTAIDLVFQAFKELNIPPKVIAMRGGTDGSALSARGLLTPNYFTGAHNFHSNFEFLPVPSFVKSLQVTQRICQLAIQEK